MHEGGEIGALRRKEKGGKQGEGIWQLRNKFRVLRTSLCAYGQLDGERDDVKVLRALRCLRR